MTILCRWLLMLGLSLAAATAQAQRLPVPVMNFENIPVSLSTDKPLSAEQVQRALVAGGANAGWEVVPKGEGRLEATYRKGDKHAVVVAIEFAPSRYSLRYVSSVNMKYAASIPVGYERTGAFGTRSPAAAAAEAQDKLFAGKPEAPYEQPDPKAVIHPFYERWVHDLLDAVRLQLKAEAVK